MYEVTSIPMYLKFDKSFSRWLLSYLCHAFCWISLVYAKFSLEVTVVPFRRSTFRLRLDVAPKRRHATHCTLYSIFPCTLFFILQVYFLTHLDVDPNRRHATHCTLYSICSLHPDQLPDLSECRISEQTDVTCGRPLHLTMLFLFYFGVREDAIATAKEGLWKRKFEVKKEKPD